MLMTNEEMAQQIAKLRELAEHTRACAYRADRGQDMRDELASAKRYEAEADALELEFKARQL